MPAYSSGASLVKVTDYGALVDGTTNDTTAVQNAANAAGGKTLYFPEGTTSITTCTLQPNTMVAGNGPTSILKQRALSAGVGSPIFTAGNNNVISGLKFDGNGVTNQPDTFSDAYNNALVAGNNYKSSTGRGRGYRCAIRMETGTGLIVTDCEFTAVAGACVGANNSSRITISNNYAHDTFWELAYVMGATSPTFASTSGQNVVITGNTMEDIASPAAASAGGYNPDSLVLSRVNGFHVANNTLSGIDRDFLKMESCKNGVVAKNTMSGGNPAINYAAMQISPMFGHHDCTSDNIRVCYNSIDGLGTDGWHNAIQINSDDSLVAITRNIEVDHNTITGIDYGIQADGATGLYNLNIHHNTLTVIAAAPIWCSGGGTGLTVNNNVKAGAVALSNQPLAIAGAWSDEAFV